MAKEFTLRAFDCGTGGEWIDHRLSGVAVEFGVCHHNFAALRASSHYHAVFSAMRAIPFGTHFFIGVPSAFATIARDFHFFLLTIKNPALHSTGV